MMIFSGKLFKYLWYKGYPKYPEKRRVGKRRKRLRRDESCDSNEKKETTLQRAESYVPDVVCWEILLRLPTKTLLRLKLVCRRWDSLISHPQFARDHLNRHRDHPVSPVWIARSPSFPFHYIDSSEPLSEGLIYDTIPITVYNSCDGIICVGIPVLGFILWNPCTNECRRIPTPGFFVGKDEMCGFGFDSCNEVYKCVRVPSAERPVFRAVEVVTLNLSSSSTTTTNSSNELIWRRIHDKFPMTFSGAAVSFHGGLYWIAFNSGASILRFDLAKERFQKVPLPFNYRAASVLSFNLGVLGTHLAAFRGKESRNGRLSTDIWIMNKDANPTDATWIKAYTIPEIPSQTMRVLPKKCYLTQKREIVIYGDDEQICVIYNPFTNDFKIDDKAALPEGLLVLHVPCLISPHLNTD